MDPGQLRNRFIHLRELRFKQLDPDAPSPLKYNNGYPFHWTDETTGTLAKALATFRDNPLLCNVVQADVLVQWVTYYLEAPIVSSDRGRDGRAARNALRRLFSIVPPRVLFQIVADLPPAMRNAIAGME